MPPTISWMAQSVRNAIRSVLLAVGLKTITAIPVSIKRSSTPPQKLQNIAQDPVEQGSTQMDLIAEVSPIEIQLVCAANC